MPQFVYVGDAGRNYVTLGISDAEPDRVYDLAADPGDGRWKPTDIPPPPAGEPAAAGNGD